MKITLKTPFNPGDLDPGKTYPHVFITSVTDYPANLFLSFTWAYGTVTTVKQQLTGAGLLGSSGTITVSNFAQGPGGGPQTYTATGDDYLAIQNAISVINVETAYQSQMRLLYQTLLNKGLVTGTISSP